MDAAGEQGRGGATGAHGERKRLVPWNPPRKTILLVEDDEEFRTLLATSLRREGYAVVEAADGDEAFEWLGPGVLERQRCRLPDLIVSDIRLPCFSGLEILEGVHIVRPLMPVILMTAFGDDRVHDEARRLGAAFTLDKPFDLAELRAAVRLALGAPAALPSARGGPRAF